MRNVQGIAPGTSQETNPFARVTETAHP